MSYYTLFIYLSIAVILNSGELLKLSILSLQRRYRMEEIVNKAWVWFGVSG